jgi:hypothetical protein
MQNYKNSLHSPSAALKRNIITGYRLLKSPGSPKTNEMNMYRPIFIFLIIALTGIILSTCRKFEDPESPDEKETLTFLLNEEINADSLRSVVNWLQQMGTRFALADNRREVAMEIKQRFIRLGYPDTRLDSFMINRTYRNIVYQQWQFNVIAEITGSVYPDSICIMGGHYDNILTMGDPFQTVPGANDNASGVAGVIELARVMKKNNYSPDNTIEFVAFGSEELGLYGSHAYARDAALNSKKIKFMLNNDMIAYQPGNDTSTWSVNILDYENSGNLRKEAEMMTAKFSFLNHYNDNTLNRYSDSYPFSLNGYKAVFFFSGAPDPYYHTLEDTVDKCNFRYSREIVKICCALMVYNN